MCKLGAWTGARPLATPWEAGGERHGYGVFEWLHDAKGWAAAEWGLSENNRRARYYPLTTPGRAQLEEERRTWDLYASAVEKALAEDVTG